MLANRTKQAIVLRTLLCARMRSAVGLAVQCTLGLIYLPSPGVGFVLRQGFPIAGPPSRQWAKPDIISRTGHETRRSTSRSTLEMSSSLDTSTAADEYEVRERGGSASASLSECGGAVGYGLCICIVAALDHAQHFNRGSTPQCVQRITDNTYQ